MAITDIKVKTFQNHNDLVRFFRGGDGQAEVATGGNSFAAPMELAGETLVVKISTDSGVSYSTTKTHTFGDGPFEAIEDVIEDIEADATFIDELVVSDDGDELVITSKAVFGVGLKVDATSTGIGGALLQFTSDQEGLLTPVTTVVQIVTDSSGHYVLFYR